MELLLSVFMSFGLVADSELKVGDKICVMHDTIAIRDEQVLDKDVEAGSCCDIKAIDGDWIEILINEKPLRVRKDFVLRIDKAIEYWNAAIIRQPKEPDFYRSRARCFYVLEKYDAAMNDYQHCVALAPADTISHFRIATMYRMQKRYRDAICSLNVSIWRYPKYQQALCLRSELYVLLNESERAMEGLDQVVAIDSQNQRPYVTRAHIHQLHRDFKSAIEDYDKLIAIDPDGCHGEMYERRGECYASLKKYSQALLDADQAISLDPNSAKRYVGRARYRYYSGNLEGSITDANHAIQLDSKSHVAYIIRARSLQDLGKYELASADYGKVLELASDRKSRFLSYMNRAESYRSMGRWKEAISDFDEGIKIAPGFADGYSYRGLCYLHLGDSNRARVDLEYAIQIEPRSVNALCNLAVFLSSVDDFGFRDLDRAIEVATLACDASLWRNKRAVVVLSRLYEVSGNKEMAIKYRENAESIAPTKGSELPNIDDIFDNPENFVLKEPAATLHPLRRR